MGIEGELAGDTTSLYTGIPVPADTNWGPANLGNMLMGGFDNLAMNKAAQLYNRAAGQRQGLFGMGGGGGGGAAMLGLDAIASTAMGVPMTPTGMLGDLAIGSFF